MTIIEPYTCPWCGRQDCGCGERDELPPRWRDDAATEDVHFNQRPDDVASGTPTTGQSSSSSFRISISVQTMWRLEQTRDKPALIASENFNQRPDDVASGTLEHRIHDAIRDLISISVQTMWRLEPSS